MFIAANTLTYANKGDQFRRMLFSVLIEFSPILCSHFAIHIIEVRK